MWQLVLCFLLVLLANCTQRLDLKGKQCPCASGYVCDTSRNVCVLPGELDVLADASPLDSGKDTGSDIISDTDLPDGGPEPSSPVIALAAGAAHNCALFEDATMRCWGANHIGQLGYGNTANIGDDEVPGSVDVVSAGGEVAQIVTAAAHSCARLSDGNVRCWGFAAFGQLGYGDTSVIGDNEHPSSVGTVSLGGLVDQLTSSSQHTCVLLNDGAVRCWGEGSSGRLGYGNTLDVGDGELPSSVGPVNTGGTVVELAAGVSHTCALFDNGAMRCWGSSLSGQLGYGNTQDIGDNELPSSVGTISVGGTVTQMAVGGHHTCALLQDGSMRCWGKNDDGQLGYGHTNMIGDDELPSSVSTVDVGGSVVQIVAGEYHTCALLDDDSVRCWGKGTSGQLGYGGTSSVGNDEHPSSVEPLELR